MHSSLAVTVTPSGGWTTLLVLAALTSALIWRVGARRTRPPRPIEIGRARPRAGPDGDLESPAVVGMLTARGDVPRSAIVATVLDLARRDWIRLANSELGEVVVIVRGTGRPGDRLRSYEQQVLNHLSAHSFDGIATATSLAGARDRLTRRWFTRFRREVHNDARERGLVTPRFRTRELIPVAIPWAIGMIAAAAALRAGEAADGISNITAWGSRVAWFAGALLLIRVGINGIRASLGTMMRPTEAGERRAGQWIGYRSRLLEVIPADASVVTTPEQQHALAFAAVMDVPPAVHRHLPVEHDDPRRAWSDAGGLAHVVNVRYPLYPGYGRSPRQIFVVGLGSVVIAQLLQRGAHRIGDGDLAAGVIDTFPDQADRVRSIIGTIGDLMWLPTAVGAAAIIIAVLARAAIRARMGLVVRARRPIDVVRSGRVRHRLVERTRFAVFLAVDDGRRDAIIAWMADERTAVPEGAHANIRATRLLGHVVESAPIGTASRSSTV